MSGTRATKLDVRCYRDKTRVCPKTCINSDDESCEYEPNTAIEVAPAPQDLPICPWHPERECPGECQYIAPGDVCLHECEEVA